MSWTNERRFNYGSLTAFGTLNRRARNVDDVKLIAGSDSVQFFLNAGSARRCELDCCSASRLHGGESFVTPNFRKPCKNLIHLRKKTWYPIVVLGSLAS